MSTGWNFNSNQKRFHKKKKKSKKKKSVRKKDIERLEENEEKVLTTDGLNCGPAGRNTLIRWIEYNYQLKRAEVKRTPAINACKVWQKTQSFQDTVLCGLVDFLKFLNVPKHITYRSVFEHYLTPVFINEINSNKTSQKSLIQLAEKMISIFQVREMQPLFSELLDKIEIIPLSVLNILTEKTPAAEYFYEITSVRVKRKMWLLCPVLFLEEVESIIEEIILRMKIKSENETIKKLILQIVELLGEEKEAKFLYNLCVHIIRLKSLESNLTTRENEDKEEEDKEKEEEAEEKEDRYKKEEVETFPKAEAEADELDGAKREKKAEVGCTNISNDNNYSKKDATILDFDSKLKKLKMCVEKVMNKKENTRDKDTDTQKSNVPSLYGKNGKKTNYFNRMCDNHLNEKKKSMYYLALNKYSYNSTSFHLLKKRKKQQISSSNKTCRGASEIEAKNKNSDNSMDNDKNMDNDKSMDNDKNKNMYYSFKGIKLSTMVNTDNNLNVFKGGDKRELKSTLKEREGRKKIKMTADTFEREKRENSSQCSSSKCENVNNNVPLLQQTFVRKGDICKESINQDQKANYKKSTEQEVNRKVKCSCENSRNQRNANEYCQNKRMLSFDLDSMFYSNLRMLLCMQYKERYNKNDADMMQLDKYFYVVELVYTIIKKGISSFQNKCALKETFNKAKRHLEIKTVDDLYEYSFLFTNYFFKFVIIEGICSYFYRDNFNILTVKDDVKLWVTFFYFGVYNSFIALMKYAFDNIEGKEREQMKLEIRKHKKYNVLQQERLTDRRNIYTRGETVRNAESNMINIHERNWKDVKFKDANGVEEYNNVGIESTDTKKRKRYNNNSNNIKNNNNNNHNNNNNNNNNNNMFYCDSSNFPNERKIETVRSENIRGRRIGTSAMWIGNQCTEQSYLRIPFVKILNYIFIPYNTKNDFFSFFDYFKEEKKKEINNASPSERIESGLKEKNTILLLAALLNLPQLDYLKIKNLFLITEEFICIEKQNIMGVNGHANLSYVQTAQPFICSSSRERPGNTTNELLNHSGNNSSHGRNRSDYFLHKSKNNNEMFELGQSTTTHFLSNASGNESSPCSSNFRKLHENRSVNLEEEKKKADIYNQLYYEDGNNEINLLKQKNMSDEIGKRLMDYIKDLSCSVGSHEFLVRHQIDSIYFYKNECPTYDVNVSSDIHENNSKEESGGANLEDLCIPPMNHFLSVSNKLFVEIGCQEKIKMRYFPYVLKICYILLQFFTRKKIINVYKKGLYLYGHFYQMTLSHILFLSTVKKCRVLQNFILRELHSFFEEFKNTKDEKKLWKFFLYANTLIDINKKNKLGVDKLFHNQVIDYFIKLFYYLSFYNVTFAIIFLKIIKMPLFFKHIEKKRGEILQNLWKGIHERSSYYFSKHKEYSVEYKIWMDLYNDLSKA